jgi:hypothetical protein
MLCLKSLFKLHTETINVHTHLFGMLFFLFLCGTTLERLHPSAGLGIWHKPRRSGL